MVVITNVREKRTQWANVFAMRLGATPPDRSSEDLGRNSGAMGDFKRGLWVSRALESYQERTQL